MSEDNTRKIVNTYSNPQVRLIDNKEQFTPNALNIGVDNSSGEIFIILGGHAFLEKDFVRKNIEILQGNLEIGCAGGQIINIYENKTGELISNAMSSGFGVGNATFRTGGEANFVDTVAFGAYWKKIHYEIGGFDEDLVRNQDDDYNFRVLKAGFKIYFDPEIISHYYVRGSYSKLYRQYYQYGYWKVYVNVKHKTVTTLRQLVPLIFVLGLFSGIILSFIHCLFFFLLVGALLLYAMLATVVGVRKSKTIKDGLKTALVFPILHFSYGLGYLYGIIHFACLSKKPSKRSKVSTRN